MPCDRPPQRKTAGQYAVSVPTTESVLLVPYATTRTALVISSPAAGNLYLSLRSDASSSNGVQMNAMYMPLQLDYDRHGELVHGPIYARMTSTSATVTYWDAHIPPP